MADQTPTSIAAKFSGDGAAYSDCRRYRYAKWETLAEGKKGALVVIGLVSCSETANDTTFATCRDFAKEAEHSAIILVNLYAIQSLDPEDVSSTLNPAGRDNDFWTLAAARQAATIVVAWGDYPRIKSRVTAVLNLLKQFDLYSVQNNRNGSPAHPAAWRLKAPKMYRRAIVESMPEAG